MGLMMLGCWWAADGLLVGCCWAAALEAVLCSLSSYNLCLMACDVLSASLVPSSIRRGKTLAPAYCSLSPSPHLAPASLSFSHTILEFGEAWMDRCSRDCLNASGHKAQADLGVDSTSFPFPSRAYALRLGFTQCPYSARTVPVQCPYSAHYKNTQCPYFFDFKKSGSLSSFL